MNFYFEATKALDRLDAKKGSIKSVMSIIPEKDRRRTAALIIETLKYKGALLEVIKTTNLLNQEKKLSSNLALLLVHDLLLSRGIQAGDGPVKQAVLRHKTRLSAEFTKLKIKRGVKSNEELAQAADSRADIPRYVRINTHAWDLKTAVRHFVSNGFIKGNDFSSKHFTEDEHVADLLLFHPNTRLHEDETYTSGKIILQDKASCFPASILAPPAADDTVAIDATSAPGNKTSHLSALMKNKGKIYAFEKDKRRFATLKKMLSKAHCKNTESINSDFLTVDPNDPRFKAVTHILVDPSCSGSGIVNRLDYLLDSEQDDSETEQRLNKLASFQLMMVKHAMKFPCAQKIVYSTCSIHSTENEEVVRAVLESPEAQEAGFRLAPREDVIPTWHRRGLNDVLPDCEDNESVIRTDPTQDRTNGFFVACFVRSTKREPGSAVLMSSSKRSHGDVENPATQPESSKRKKRRKKVPSSTTD